MLDTERQFTISVHGVMPEDIPLTDLAAFASNLASAVKGEQAKSERPPEGKPSVALVSLTRGSWTACCQSDPATAPVIRRMLAAISSPEVNGLALKPATRAALDKAFSRLGGSGREIRISSPMIGGRELVYRRLTEPPAVEVVKGETEVAVKVLSVSGGRGTGAATVQPLDGGPSFECRVASDNLLRDVGGRIKLRVILEGVATWELPAWQIIGFEVRQVLPYPDGPLAEGFAELAAAFGEEDIDAAIRQITMEESGEGIPV